MNMDRRGFLKVLTGGAAAVAAGAVVADKMVDVWEVWENPPVNVLPSKDWREYSGSTTVSYDPDRREAVHAMLAKKQDEAMESLQKQLAADIWG